MKPPEEIPPKELQKMVLSYLEERFGLDPGTFDGYGLYLSTKGRVFLGPKRLIDKPKIVTLGLLIARYSGAVKPTTNLLQAFGSNVRKNAIQLTKEQTISYVRGQDVALNDSQNAQEGYILLRYGSSQLGCGHLKGKIVKNMLPKAKRMELKYL